MPININVLKKYKSSNLFIETGAYVGDGISVAVECGYEQIYSVELSDYYYNYCINKFKNNNKINLINDSSEIALPQLLKKIGNIKCDFWLDAHYSKGNTAMGNKICPLYDELAAILSHKNNHTILIDDVRLMDTDWWQDVYKNKIIELIMSCNSEYKIFYENGHKENDILIAKIM